MQSPKSNEKEIRIERAEEIRKNYYKARQFPLSVIGRKRLRMMRFLFHKLNIPFLIPMNSAFVTDDYCQTYNKEPEQFHDGLLF